MMMQQQWFRRCAGRVLRFAGVGLAATILFAGPAAGQTIGGLRDKTQEAIESFSGGAEVRHCFALASAFNSDGKIGYEEFIGYLGGIIENEPFGLRGAMLFDRPVHWRRDYDRSTIFRRNGFERSEVVFYLGKTKGSDGRSWYYAAYWVDRLLLSYRDNEQDLSPASSQQRTRYLDELDEALRAPSEDGVDCSALGPIDAPEENLPAPEPD